MKRERFKVYDLEEHLALYPVPETAQAQIGELVAKEKALGRLYSAPQGRKDVIGGVVEHWVTHVLNTLPKGAMVNSRQLLEAFCPDYNEDQFILWSKCLSFLRTDLHRFKGYYSEGAVKTNWGKPFINYHRKENTDA